MLINYIIVMPAYEPDEKLVEVLKMTGKGFDVVLVNDGSDSSYNPIFEAAARYARVISYKENRGKGYALKTGFAYVKEHYQNYVVVTMDSDGQHTVADAVKLCKAAEADKKSLMLGKRRWGKGTPFKSRMGNAITRTVCRLITGQNIYDTQTGMRAFSDELMDYMISVKGDRYEYEMNVLLHLKRQKIAVKEIPIETIYFDGNKGSHFDAVKDSLKIYRDITLFALSSISSFAIDYALYALFVFFKMNVTAANVLARIISALYNYTVNKRAVFRNDKKSTFVQYAVLAAAILLLNTIILNAFVKIGLNEYIAKVVTELALFALSFIVQKNIIFKKGGGEK